MAPADDLEPGSELSPRERARVRARDRKRSTRMVVDNAGVKRTALALAQRRSAPARGDTPGDPANNQGG